MSDHATLSPSRRYRFALCPGSVREEARYPDVSGPAAIDGTHTHTLIERCVMYGLVDPHNYVGQTLTDHEGSFTVDPLRADRAKVTIDYVKGRVGDRTDVQVFAERKVDPQYLVGRSDMSGTVDITLVFPDEIELIDHKDGMNPTYDSAKYQLEQYAVGTLAGYKIPRGLPYPFRNVRLTISQPKLAVMKMNPIYTWEVSTDYVVDVIVGNLVVEGKRVDDPDAPLIAGELQCKYCKNKTCAKRYEKSMDMINVIPILDISSQSANKDPSRMSDAELAQVLEAAPLIKQLIEGAQEEAEKRLKSGSTVPGFKLVKGRGSRSWSLSDDDIAERLIKMGVPKGMVYESKLVSPAKVEKLTWEKKGTKTSLSERQIKTLNSEYISMIDGKPTLAPVSDSRPAISFTAESLFAPIGEKSVENELPTWML